MDLFAEVLEANSLVNASDKKFPIQPMKDSDGLSKPAAVMMEGFKNMHIHLRIYLILLHNL